MSLHNGSNGTFADFYSQEDKNFRLIQLEAEMKHLSTKAELLEFKADQTKEVTNFFNKVTVQKYQFLAVMISLYILTVALVGLLLRLGNGGGG